MKYGSDSFRLLSAYQLLSLLALLVGSPSVMPETPNEHDQKTVQLSNKEILLTFANVRDDAEVQDAAETRAVNHWYADGRFTSSWSNRTASGKVTGTWRAKNNLRCITISTGLPKRIGKESCSPVFRRGNKLVSINADGSIHGIHSLSPSPQ